MDVGATFVANYQAMEFVEPGEAALDDLTISILRTSSGTGWLCSTLKAIFFSASSCSTTDAIDHLRFPPYPSPKEREHATRPNSLP